MESVEQLCDSIALINKSHKILDGKVSDIKNSYRNNTFRIEFTGQFPAEKTDLFSIVSTGKPHEIHIKIAEGKTPNEVLNYLLPHIQIQQLSEVIPSINDIFIQKVSH
jgi:ABC-2 type transport system ATP-binding protein